VWMEGWLFGGNVSSRRICCGERCFEQFYVGGAVVFVLETQNATTTLAL
jgi:hypothetical protein